MLARAAAPGGGGAGHAGEAIATLRDQGRDTTTLLDLLLAEVADLEQLAGEVLAERRSGPAEAALTWPRPCRAAARTVAVAQGDRARRGGRPGRGRGQPDTCCARRSRT